MHDWLNIFLHLSAVVKFSVTDLSYDYSGRRLNQQPIAIIDLPESSDTRKILQELYWDMNDLAMKNFQFKKLYFVRRIPAFSYLSRTLPYHYLPSLPGDSAG